MIVEMVFDASPVEFLILLFLVNEVLRNVDFRRSSPIVTWPLKSDGQRPV